MKPRNIQNLPPKFDLSHLDIFDFGMPDAKDDPLLSVCALKIAPIAQFLSGNKSILVGDRGAGKTAVFKLLADRKLQFSNSENLRQIIIPIDEELSYKTLRGHVSQHIRDANQDDSSSHRLIWELFIFSRCLDELKERFEADRRLERLAASFYEALGWESNRKVGLVDILLNTKKTFGVKLESGHMGYVVPNFYTSVEPKKESEDLIADAHFLDLPTFKKDLDRILQEKKAVAYILIDKLDEFVSGEEYLTQLSTLQSLLQSWRDYQSYPRLKVKLFFRKDLYERLDFSSIGRDKIEPRKVDLVWTDEDIRNFIAFRVLHNVAPLAKGRPLTMVCDEKSLRIDRQFLKELRSIDSRDRSELSLWDKVRREFLILRDRLRSRKKDAYDGRTVNIHDMVYEALITLLFPRAVNHKNKQGKVEQMELMAYFSSHFRFSGNSTTPRIILLFLQYCLEMARAYYGQNPQEFISANDRGEYPVFLRDHLSDAYEKTRNLAVQTIVGLNNKWQRHAMNIMQHVSNSRNPEVFSYKEIAKFVPKETASAGSDVARFFAFYEHAGLFRCTNRHEKLENRTYGVPVIFQRLSSQAFLL